MATVLVVDDKAEIRLLLKAAVEREGHEVRMAGNAQEAREQMQAGVDLLFVDINLPGETGVDLAVSIRQQPRYANIPVVFVSAHPEANRIVAGVRSGPNLVLAKPFRFQQVAEKLREALPQKS